MITDIDITDLNVHLYGINIYTEYSEFKEIKKYKGFRVSKQRSEEEWLKVSRGKSV